MKVIKHYPTKAKWQLAVNEKGFPYVGYYQDKAQPYDVRYNKDAVVEALGPGVNVLMEGELMITGFERGRSAASYILKSACGWKGVLTGSGALDLFRAVARGDATIREDTWPLPSYSEGTSLVNGAVVSGLWTFTKQGTEVGMRIVGRDFC